MDIKAIAIAAIALLSPYLVKAGEAFAGETGKKLLGKAGELYDKIKQKFKGDGYAEQTLARLEEKPQSEERQVALRGMLVEKMADDNDFAEAVRQLVEASQELSGGDTIIQHLVVSGKADNVSQLGKIEGDDNIIERSPSRTTKR